MARRKGVPVHAPAPIKGIKYIISLDIALRNVGVCVHDNTGEMLEAFNISTKQGWPDHTSTDHIVEELFKRLDRYLTLALTPHVVVYVEDVIFAQKGKGHARSEVTGVIKWNLRQQGFMIYGVTPTAWESYLFALHNTKPTRPGGGRVRTVDIKACTMAVIHRAYNYYTENDNIADAIGIGKFGLAHSIERKRLAVRACAQVV